MSSDEFTVSTTDDPAIPDGAGVPDVEIVRHSMLNATVADDVAVGSQSSSNDDEDTDTTLSLTDELAYARYATTDDGYVLAECTDIERSESQHGKLIITFDVPGHGQYTDALSFPMPATDDEPFVKFCHQYGARIDSYNELIVGSHILVEPDISGWSLVIVDEPSSMWERVASWPVTVFESLPGNYSPGKIVLLFVLWPALVVASPIVMLDPTMKSSVRMRAATAVMTVLSLSMYALTYYALYSVAGTAH